MNKGKVSQFIIEHYKHFNAAALTDAAKAYEAQIEAGNKMMLTLCRGNEYGRNRKIAGRNDTAR